uniref:Uncharacterized protein n=2 Tax=Takifugu rubripes TaxID=31033 RepID=A0A674NEN0_TAKRU
MSAAVGMSSLRVWVLVLVRFCCFFVHAEVTTSATSRNAAPGTTAYSSTAANGTEAGPKKSGPGGLNVDSSMIQRALYVLIGITMTGVLYFLIRAVRLKRPAPRRKYGLLSNYDDSVEMVEGESEEDDTLYEARSLRRSEVTLPVSPAVL